MTEYSVYEFILIVFNILAMLGLSWYARTDLKLSVMFLVLVIMYSLLKFFDLSDLYPSFLWMTFNLCQAGTFFYILKQDKLIKNLLWNS